jgi:hypothetical protein
LPTGGTAAEEVGANDKGIMVRYRGWLDGWRTVLKENIPVLQAPTHPGLGWPQLGPHQGGESP